jgi:hypothetical protein
MRFCESMQPSSSPWKKYLSWAMETLAEVTPKINTIRTEKEGIFFVAAIYREW